MWFKSDIFGLFPITLVISTIKGDSNIPFYKELGNQGPKATEVPMVAFSVDEEGLRGIDD
jgi:Periplasmic binding protein domain